MQVGARVRAAIELPEDAFAGDVPLVAVMRGRYIGGLHRGTLALVDADGTELLCVGDVGQPVFLRSAAKPFQIMPAVLSGAIERYDIAPSELAVLCASHRGEPRHVEAVSSILARADLDTSALHCGVHPPLSPAAAEALARERRFPVQLHNNCSGAHSGMLLACLANGWPTEDYGSADHPLQILTREILAEFAGVRTESITMAVDNCAVPAFRLPVRAGALAFARLVSGTGVRQELKDAAARVVAAMTQYPEMVGGEGSFDTALMQSARGEILSKGGAEGFSGIGIPSAGLGMALKITDGNSRAIPPTVLTILESLDLLPAGAATELSEHRRPEVRNHNGELVGRLAAVFDVETDA